MTVLEDIQENTSEFNIKYHLEEFVGRAMLAVFMVEENQKQMEKLMKMEIDPFMRTIVIGHAFDEIARAYLSEPTGGSDEEDEESEE